MIEPDIPIDPFRERGPRARRLRFRMLGARFEFHSTSAALLAIARSAYSDLPVHAWGRTDLRCRIDLVPIPGKASRSRSEPRPARLFSAGRALCAVADESTFVTVSPEDRYAIVAVPPRMLEFEYHLRYELIDLAVYLLAARCRGLIPLHAACLSSRDRGILLTGPSGSGKSTLALQWLAQGLDFVSEDSVLVDPRSLHATGLANFAHLRSDSLRFLDHPRLQAAIRASPVIRRRSGVKKFEVDLRACDCNLAPRPPRLQALVFASAQKAPGSDLLRALSHREVLKRLRASQPYALQQQGWATFSKSLSRMNAFELRRGRHPAEAASVLRDLLMTVRS
jgi:hypothetical protein